MSATRRVPAILAADVAGYSRLMGEADVPKE
jgi:class 3 adenylate cyclase